MHGFRERGKLNQTVACRSHAVGGSEGGGGVGKRGVEANENCEIGKPLPRPPFQINFSSRFPENY